MGLGLLHHEPIECSRGRAMAKTTESTIATALKMAGKEELLVPAIQRDFVWSNDQICDLFDSAMRGYPIGTLLLWRLSGDVAKKTRWYRLLDTVDRRYPQNRSAVTAKASVVSAVLDGQQRLTAFNIGINGSIRPRTSNPVPASLVLWIDAAHEATDTEPGERRFWFEFGPDEENQLGGDGECWIKVSDIANAKGRAGVKAVVPSGAPAGCLDRADQLRSAIQEKPIVTWQTVKDDDVDGVLNIFIKANSKGTALKHEDIMLAIANSEWTVDAHAVVNDLRNDIQERFGLQLSVTRIMKTSIVLLSSGNQLGFQASNLTRDRLRRMERNWPTSSTAMLVAGKMLHSFGLTQRTLTAENVLIPLAIYAQHRKLTEDWVDKKSSKADLERIRKFVYRSLVKKEFWTGAVDPVLVACRKVITAKPGLRSFPLPELIAELAKISPAKNLDFTSEEIMSLLSTPYRDRRSTILLSLMYPSMADPDSLDKDHVFPTSRVTKTAVKKAGLNPDIVFHRIKHRSEQLPNLCLLDGRVNKGLKGPKTPRAWLDNVAATQGPSARARLVKDLDLQFAPESIGEVVEFWAKRQRRMKKRLEQLLS